jgi:hypothetical protein
MKYLALAAFILVGSSTIAAAAQSTIVLPKHMLGHWCVSRDGIAKIGGDRTVLSHNPRAKENESCANQWAYYFRKTSYTRFRFEDKGHCKFDKVEQVVKNRIYLVHSSCKRITGERLEENWTEILRLLLFEKFLILDDESEDEDGRQSR